MAEINIEKMAHIVAQKAIQELRDNGVFVSRWIPVSERLPGKDGEYLLWGKICEDEENNYCFIGEYDSCAEEFGYWSDHYDSSTLGFLDSEHIEYHKVLAWMPLPAPYEPQERESDA